MSATTGQKRGAAPASGMTERGSCGCGGTQSAGAATTDDDPCCGLKAPERPVFFCGQLLRDDDLKLGFDYERHLARLRNRELFGAGVVCGLQLEVDIRPDHKKTIIVRPGLAFDGCGRPVVVPEAMAFDVIARLKKMQVNLGLPVSPAKPEEGEVTKAKETSPTQSFQVVLRYAQSFDDYTTPFLSDCDPAPQACQPTRIRETFCLDLLDGATPRANATERIRARITESVSLLVEGRFWKTLSDKAPELLGFINTGQSPASDYDNARSLFDSLRLALADYLRSNPDRYNADTDTRLASIGSSFPDKPASGSTATLDFRPAFRELLGLAWRYVVSRYRAAVLPVCDDGACAGPILLGTVEVLGDRVVRVCEVPRDQVLSPAHLVEFVHSMLAAGNARETEKAGSPNGSNPVATAQRIRCDEPDLDVVNLLSELTMNPKAIVATATNAVIAIDRMRDSLMTAFDFVAPRRFEPSMLHSFTRKDAKAKLIAYLVAFGVKPEDAEKAVLVNKIPADPALPHEALRRVGLGSPGDRFQLYVDDANNADSLVLDAFASREPVVPLSADDAKLLHDAVEAANAVAGLKDDVKKTNERVDDLATEETQLSADNTAINTQLNLVDKKIGELLDTVNKLINDQVKTLIADVTKLKADVAALQGGGAGGGGAGGGGAGGGGGSGGGGGGGGGSGGGGGT